MARCPERAWFDYLLPGAQANAVERKRMREAPAAEQIPRRPRHHPAISKRSMIASIVVVVCCRFPGRII